MYGRLIRKFIICIVPLVAFFTYLSFENFYQKNVSNIIIEESKNGTEVYSVPKENVTPGKEILVFESPTPHSPSMEPAPVDPHKKDTTVVKSDITLLFTFQIALAVVLAVYFVIMFVSIFKSQLYTEKIDNYMDLIDDFII